MRIVVDGNEQALQRIRDAVPDADVVSGRAAIEQRDPPDVVFGRPSSERLLPLVRRGASWVHCVGAGVDGIDPRVFDHAVVTASKGATAVPIAEYVLASILTFEKRFASIFVTEAPSSWYRHDAGIVAGRTLGLVGLGHIGTAVATRASAFDMDVVAVRRTDAPAPLPGVRMLRREEVLAQADHLVLTAPLTAETRGLLDEEAFASMKPGAHLVNVSRGELVDQDALRGALDRGALAGATLDVCVPEPLPAGHWLYGHPRVRLSPHCSWSSPDPHEATIGIFLDNLERHRSGQPLRGVVDPVASY